MYFFQKLICYRWGDRTHCSQPLPMLCKSFCLSTLIIGIFTQEHSIEGTGLTYSPPKILLFLVWISGDDMIVEGGGFLALEIVLTQQSLNLIIRFLLSPLSQQRGHQNTCNQRIYWLIRKCVGIDSFVGCISIHDDFVFHYIFAEGEKPRWCVSMLFKNECNPSRSTSV